MAVNKDLKQRFQDHVKTLAQLGYTESEPDDLLALVKTVEGEVNSTRIFDMIERFDKTIQVQALSTYCLTGSLPLPSPSNPHPELQAPDVTIPEKFKASKADRDEDLLLPAKWETRISGKATATTVREFVINNHGIWEDVFSKNNSTRHELWRWDDFEILMVLVQVFPREVFYEARVNGVVLPPLNVVDLRERLAPDHLKYARDKQIFGPLLVAHVREANTPTKTFSDTCGFTKEGWCLPGDGIHELRFTRGIQESIRAPLTRMMDQIVYPDEAKAYMKSIYTNVHAEFKDIFFARAMIMPFLHALKDRTELVPWFSAGGGPGTGKTSLLEILTKKIWGFPEILKKDTIESEARAGNYFSMSTFGIVIDDCGDLNIKIQNTMKSMTTTATRHQRLKTNQELDIDREMTSPINFTFNTTPAIMDDPAFLERGVHVPLTLKMTVQDKTGYDLIKKTVPDGYLGKFIYTQTKSWNVQTILDIMAFQDNMKGVLDTRPNIIYRLFKCGESIMSALFDINLDLSALPELIKQTATMGSDNLYDVITEQLIAGDIDPEHLPRWMAHPIIKRSDCYMFTVSNLIDLNDRMKSKIKDLRTLTELLQKRWTGLEYKKYKINNASRWAISIPLTCLTSMAQEREFVAERGFINYAT